MRNRNQILAANQKYAASYGDKRALPMAASRRIAVVTCMDARLDPARFMGLAEGEAHVIRNAGGRASDDVIRSLVISHKLQGTNEWFVIHHTGCGQLMVSEDDMRRMLASSLDPATFDGKEWRESPGAGPGSTEAQYIDWLTIKDPAQALIDDVRRIRNHPLVPSDVRIYGYVFDVKTGKLTENKAATAAGRASALTTVA